MTPPPRPIVRFEARVTRGISSEAFPSANGVPPAEGEIGGILLGTRSAGAILVEDFEPVLCSHRFGPSYVLSDEDQRGLEESLEWFRALPGGGLETLGFYRTQASPDFSWNERDEELMRRFYPQSGSLLLLLKPCPSQGLTAEFFVLGEGILRPAADPAPFPLVGASEIALFPMEAPGFADAMVPIPEPVPEALVAEPVVAEPAALEPARPELPVAETAAVEPANFGRETRPSERRPLPPPTRSRRLEPEDAPDRSWLWVAALVLLTVMGAVLGYRSVGPPPPASPLRNSQPQRSTPQPPAARVPDPAPPTGPAAPSPDPPPVPAASARPDAAASSDRAVSPEVERGIQSAIQRWQRAIRSGEPDLIAACYLPQLERYFNQRNSSSAVVRKAALKSKATYGRPSILRISGLSIIPVSQDRAIATFRKHWQTAGPRVFAGEEQERLALVRLGREWKIASEEQTKVYWTQRP